MLLSKRQAFHSQIRNKQIKTIIHKLRVHATKQNRSDMLQTLISNTTTIESITKQQVIMLMKWGLMGEEDAVLYLGNLVIDGILGVEMIEECQGRGDGEWYGESQEYLWLIHIFYERNWFKERELLFLAKSVIRIVNGARKMLAMAALNHSTFFYQHGLTLLKKIISKHSSAAELLLTETSDQLGKNLLKSLIFLCENGTDSKVVQISCSILNCFAGLNVKQCNIAGLITTGELKSLAEKGRLSMQTKVRCLIYQIFGNLLVSLDEPLEPLYLGLILQSLPSWPKQKVSVQVEISYFILIYIKKSHLKIVKYLLTEKLIYYVMELLENQPKNEEIVSNCMEILKFLHENKEKLHSSSQIDPCLWYLFSQSLSTKLAQYYNSFNFL